MAGVGPNAPIRGTRPRPKPSRDSSLTAAIMAGERRYAKKVRRTGGRIISKLNPFD